MHVKLGKGYYLLESIDIDTLTYLNSLGNLKGYQHKNDKFNKAYSYPRRMKTQRSGY